MEESQTRTRTDVYESGEMQHQRYGPVRAPQKFVVVVSKPCEFVQNMWDPNQCHLRCHRRLQYWSPLVAGCNESHQGH